MSAGGMPTQRYCARFAASPLSQPTEIRLIGLLVFLSPLRHQLRQFRFGQFRHLKQSDALVTEIAWLRHLFFVRPPFFGARSRARRSHDPIFMLEPALIRNRSVLPQPRPIVFWWLFLPDGHSSRPKVRTALRKACRASRSTASRGLTVACPSRPTTVIPSRKIASRHSRALWWASKAVVKTAIAVLVENS